MPSPLQHCCPSDSDWLREALHRAAIWVPVELAQEAEPQGQSLL